MRASVAEAAVVRSHVRRFLAERQAEAAASRATQTIAADIRPSALLDWAERYRRIDDRPFSLDRFAPLRAIYADDHPHIVVIKPSQRGLSEWAINYAIFALDRGAEVWADGAKTGLNVGYLFPTQAALSAFSKERISGLKRESPYLASLLGDTEDFDTVDFKQIRDSYLYLRGGWSEAGLLSFAADVAIFDEYDRMEASAIALGRRRLNASTVRRELDLSTPTLPGVGIHGLYLQSDRHVYEQWHRCGSWVSFDFWRDVRVDGHPYEAPGGRGWRTYPAELIRASDVRLHCPACGEPIVDEERVAPGRWRAEAPDVKGLRGYHVPWWPFPVVDLVEYAVTAVSQDPSELTELYRSDLGLPYESSGSRITREMLAALSADLPGGVLPDLAWSDTTLGVDVGARFHYRVSSRGSDGRRYVRAAGSVTSWDEVDGLMSTYGVRLAVVDAMPEMHAARSFADRHPGRAVTATYPTANALKGVMWAPADAAKIVEDGRVQINRTMAMDAVFAAVAKAEERWPASVHSDPEVVEHLTAPVRVTTLDAHGQPKADWVHTKPDHLYHACLVAGTLVRTEHGDLPIEDVRAGMRVWTRQGLRHVRAAAMTARATEVRTYHFTNGTTLTGTPNHPIHTEGRGFIPLGATVYDDIITAWPGSRRSSIAASCSVAIRTVRAAVIGFISPRVDGTGRTASSGCIRRSGRTPTARFRMDASSTTATRIPSTTSPRISSASRRASTALSMRRSSGRPALTSTQSVRWPTNGTDQRKADAGIASTPSNHYGSSSRASTTATAVASISLRCPRPATIVVGLAPTPATARRDERAGSTMPIGSVLSAAGRSASTATERRQPVRASAVRPSGSVAAGRADVFNLSVDGAEEYFANGLLVHNCVYETVARALLPPAPPTTAPQVMRRASPWRRS